MKLTLKEIKATTEYFTRATVIFDLLGKDLVSEVNLNIETDKLELAEAVNWILNQDELNGDLDSMIVSAIEAERYNSALTEEIDNDTSPYEEEDDVVEYDIDTCSDE